MKLKKRKREKRGKKRKKRRKKEKKEKEKGTNPLPKQKPLLLCRYIAPCCILLLLPLEANRDRGQSPSSWLCRVVRDRPCLTLNTNGRICRRGGITLYEKTRRLPRLWGQSIVVLIGSGGAEAMVPPCLCLQYAALDTKEPMSSSSSMACHMWRQGILAFECKATP